MSYSPHLIAPILCGSPRIGDSKDLRDAQEGTRMYGVGMDAGRRGEPKPEEPPAAILGWAHGDTKRKIVAGEVLGLIGQGTRCSACLSQFWGWRLGCSCWSRTAADERPPIEYGHLIDDGQEDAAPARFMTATQVSATGLPLVDCFTGQSVALDTSSSIA